MLSVKKNPVLKRAVIKKMDYFIRSILFLFIIITFMIGCKQDPGSSNDTDSDSPSSTIPTAPSELSLSVISNSEIELIWSDNSDNELGFKIERAPDSSGQAGTFVEISAVSANKQSYTDSTLKNDTTYYYRICAYNNIGSSAYTRESKICTPPFFLRAYYVDFSNGDDSASGTSPENAWKHAPGDPNAAGNADRTLQPGDAVLFKGGVKYNGSITINASGTAVNPIIYKGDSWGNGKAILDGSEILTGWIPCDLAEDCEDNPNWENIYYAYVPASIACTAFTANLHENDEFLWIAQDPNLPDPFYRDQISYFHTLPIGAMQATSLTYADYFNQDDSDYWQNSSVMLWHSPNIVTTREILSFDPDTYTITYENVGGGGVYTDRETYFSIINSLHALDKAGEYYFHPIAETDGSHKVYLWPYETSHLAQDITVSTRSFGINIADRSFITIEGFKVQKYSGDGLTDCGIGSVTSASTSKEHIVVRNNYIRHDAHAGDTGYGGVYLSKCDNSLVENNIIEENVLTTGIFITGSDHAIARGNTIRRPGHTGMWFFGDTNSQIVSNTVTEVYGTHGNGITCYLSCNNILLAWNKLVSAGAGFTLQASTNMYFYRNLVDAADGGSNVNEWGGTAPEAGGKIIFLNNTFVRNNRNASLNIGGTTGCSYIVKNNIIDGGGGGERSHNIYVGLLWNQTAAYGWYPAEGEAVQTDLSQIFANPTNGDFHIKSGSPAIDAGTDISAYLPMDTFPDVDFNKDIDGNYTPINSACDIGAYEFP